MESEFAHRLSVLGHPQRLAIFRLLVRRYPDRVPAGEIAAALDLPASTLSAYLAALTRAGLAAQTRAGTSVRYAAAMSEVRRTLDFLVLDCCRGRPECCAALAPAAPEEPAMADARLNVLFICTGNSARSIFAESILRTEAGGRFNAFSAGTRPYTALNPFALEVLRAQGHDLAPLRAKTVDEFRAAEAPPLDFVFTVCDRAANEDCPAWDGRPVTGHWGVPDPVTAEGTDAEKSLAFHRAYAALRNRIRAFAALPVETLDRLSLQRAVDGLSLNGDGVTS